MNLDPNWQHLQEAWQTSASDDPTLVVRLKARVRRESRRMKLVVALEAAIAVIALAASTAGVIRGRSADMWSLAVMVWCFTLTACAFSFLNRRGLWDAEHDGVSLLNLSIRRAQAKIAAADFGIVLTFIETVFLGIWKTRVEWLVTSQRSLLWSESILILVGCGMAAWLFYYRARTRRESENLKALLRSLKS